jgi:hypothetical protein
VSTTRNLSTIDALNGVLLSVPDSAIEGTPCAAPLSYHKPHDDFVKPHLPPIFIMRIS